MAWGDEEAYYGIEEPTGFYDQYTYRGDVTTDAEIRAAVGSGPGNPWAGSSWDWGGIFKSIIPLATGVVSAVLPRSTSAAANAPRLTTQPNVIPRSGVAGYSFTGTPRPSGGNVGAGFLDFGSGGGGGLFGFSPMVIAAAVVGFLVLLLVVKK